MKSSLWQKRNAFIMYAGLALTLILAGVLQRLSLPNPPQLELILFVVVVGVSLTFFLKARYPIEMVRRVRLEYQAAVNAVQDALKASNIRYYRVDEEDSVNFKVFGLTVTLVPYEVEKLTHIEPSADYTLVTLEGINRKNIKLAEMVAETLNKIES